MTLDARAMVSVARRGPGYEMIVDAIAKDETPRICATALAEATILLRATGDNMAELTVQSLVDHLNLTVVPFTQSDWKAAAQAYEVGVKTDTSRSTFGWCLSEAVAVSAGARLLGLPPVKIDPLP